MMLLGLLGILADAAAGDNTGTVIGGVLGTALTILNMIQTGQMSGLRHDFQTYRDAQDRRVKALEDEVAEHRRILDGPRRAKATGSHSTTRGKR